MPTRRPWRCSSAPASPAPRSAAPGQHRRALVRLGLGVAVLLHSALAVAGEPRTSTYTYDRVGRLVSASDEITHIGYVYDQGGNLLSRTVPEPGPVSGLVVGLLALAALGQRPRLRRDTSFSPRSGMPRRTPAAQAAASRRPRLALPLAAILFALPAEAQLLIDDFSDAQPLLNYNEQSPVFPDNTVAANVPGGSRFIEVGGAGTGGRTFDFSTQVAGGTFSFGVSVPPDTPTSGNVSGSATLGYPGGYLLDASGHDAITFSAEIVGSPPPIPPVVTLLLHSPGVFGQVPFVLDDPALQQGPAQVVIPLQFLGPTPNLAEIDLISMSIDVAANFGAGADYTLAIDDLAFGTLATPAKETSAQNNPLPDAVPTSPTAVLQTGRIEQDPANLPGIANDPVVVATGEFLGLDAFDRRLRGPTGLAFVRTYASFQGDAVATAQVHGVHDSPLGAHWSHNFHELLRRESATRVTILFRKGAILVFEKQGSDWVFQPVGYRGIPYQLVETGSKLELMDPQTRRIHRFEFATIPDGGGAPVEQIRDRNGSTQTLVYNPDGTLASVSDGLGRSLGFTHISSSGVQRIASATDPSGRVVSYGYTGASLTSVTDARSGVTQYAYDADQHMTSMTRPRGNVPLQNSYQPDGRVLTQTDGEGAVHSFFYGAGSSAVLDPLGHVRGYLWDANARVTAFSDEAGQLISYSYDPDHRRQTTTDRLGDTQSLTYHAPSGYVASRTDAQGNPWSYTYTLQQQEGFDFYLLTAIDRPDGSQVTLGYDVTGNLTTYTDGEGNTTTWTYNGRGQPLTRTNAALGVTIWTYNADATVATREDPSGNVTTFSYDAAKRAVSIQRPGPTATTFSWDANDNRLTATDENGNTTTSAYDANDNVTSVTDPEGHVTTFAYDGNDDLLQMTDPRLETTTFGYDGLRRVETAMDARGNTTSFVYDARRRLVEVVDRDGNSWQVTYDLEAVPTSFIDPLDQTWLSQSDELGRITRIEDPLGNVWLFAYDAVGRLVSVTDPLSQEETVARDDNGDVTAMHLDLPGQSALYAFNALRQIEAITDLLGEAWSQPKDSQGRTVSRTDPLGQTETYTYDTRNRLDLVTLPGGLGTLDLGYDAADRLTTIDYSDGTSFTRTYDDEDLLVATTGVSLSRDERGQITDSNGVTLTYDASGNLETLTYGPGKTVTYAYDARELLASVTDWAGGVTTFTYDDDAKLLSIDHANGTRTGYGYDLADRLIAILETTDDGATRLSDIALQRDADGQITQAIRDLPLQAGSGPTAVVGQAYDAASQPLGTSHDALGRLTNDGRTFVWNLADQLLSVTDGGQTVMFTRDGFGNVLSRTSGGTIRRFVWNYALGLPSIATETGNAGPLRHHVYTPDGLLLYSLEASNDARRVYHFDEMGSTVFVTDGGAQIIQSYAFAPWGEVLAESGGLDNSFAWHGRYGVQREGGLYSMRARYYDPVRTRFLSRDPLQQLDARSSNPYQALFGNPLTFIDPRGTDPYLPLGACPWSCGLRSYRTWSCTMHNQTGCNFAFGGVRPRPEPEPSCERCDEAILSVRATLGYSKIESLKTLRAIGLVFLPIDDSDCVDGGDHGVINRSFHDYCRCRRAWQLPAPEGKDEAFYGGRVVLVPEGHSRIISPLGCLVAGCECGFSRTRSTEAGRAIPAPGTLDRSPGSFPTDPYLYLQSVIQRSLPDSVRDSNRDPDLNRTTLDPELDEEIL